MSSITDYIVQRLLILPGIIVGLSFHEYGHAKVSSMLGDPTPRYQGRVSLNPAAHIDPIGFILLLVIGFGWGKPVQIDPRYYKHRRLDAFLVSIAGVVINLLLAFAGCALWRVIYLAAPDFLIGGTTGAYIVNNILAGFISINLVLMVFNLIPLPPLDGFGVITQIFNLETKSWYDKFYRFGPAVLMLLIVLNVTDKILTPVVSSLYSLIVGIFF